MVSYLQIKFYLTTSGIRYAGQVNEYQERYRILEMVYIIGPEINMRRGDISG